jgi:hypothetical protein
MNLMISFARWLFTMTIGVTIGWVIGTLGFMSNVASLERNAERKASSVKNHPSSRNSNNSSAVGNVASTRRIRYNPNIYADQIKVSRRLATTDQWDANYDKYKPKPE